MYIYYIEKKKYFKKIFRRNNNIRFNFIIIKGIANAKQIKLRVQEIAYICESNNVNYPESNYC